jgi:hypothetical protein
MRRDDEKQEQQVVSVWTAAAVLRSDVIVTHSTECTIVCSAGVACVDTTANPSSLLTLSNPIFYHPHTPQLLFILGGKEVSGLLVIILQF